MVGWFIKQARSGLLLTEQNGTIFILFSNVPSNLLFIYLFIYLFINGSWGEGGSKIAETIEAVLNLIILTLEDALN